MSLSSILHCIISAIDAKDDAIFRVSVSDQEAFLKAVHEPEDDLQRSYNQYKCQMHLIRNPILKGLMNLVALPLIFVYLIKPKTNLGKQIKIDSVFFADGKKKDILPNCLTNGKTIELIEDKSEFKNKEMMLFFVSIVKRYPFSWFFLLKTLIKLRYYCFVIYKYSPDEIISCNEYSFTSSILTRYCEKNGIRHVNVMHGEKLFFIRDSFFRYNKCYVWNQFYIELFKELRAEKTQFEVAIPPSLRIVAQINPSVDYKYYLADERKEVIDKIIGALSELQKQGNIVQVRPHPRYTNINTISRIKNNGLFIEDTQEVDIEQSIASTRCVISLYSTVINQAYNSGVDVVIDDVSDQSRYEKLKERKYRFIEDKRIGRLSQILKI